MTYKDPVCLMDVEPGTAAGTRTHAGTTYYFCSDWCAQKFKEAPDRYLAPAGEAARAASKDLPASSSTRQESDAVYTCPMHPEIRQEGPGRAPSVGWPWSRWKWMRGRSAIRLGHVLPVEDRRPSDRTASAVEHGRNDSRARAAHLDARDGFPLGPAHAGDSRGVMGGLPFSSEAGIPSCDFGSTCSPSSPWEPARRTFPAWLPCCFLPFPSSFRDEHGGIPLYFEAAAVITVLVLLGQVLELKARGRTRSAIRSLLRLAPDSARRVRPDGMKRTCLCTR